MADDVYVRLAEHLDRAVAGVPMSPTLMKILAILYPWEEAEVALKLTFFDNKTAQQWAEVIPDKAEELPGILDRMAKRGTVYSEQRPGQERTYRLLPSIVGFTETPFWAGEDTETARALAPLWFKYYSEEFGGELGRGVPLVRVVPITDSLEDASEVLPFDAISERIKEGAFIAVAHCPCRQISRYVGEGCEHTLENCLHFGGMARYIVEQGMGRRISKDETLRILKDATEEGLVHVCDNIEGALGTICNCCSCCCAFLKSKNIAGHDCISRSNYVARVDGESCTACAVCEERCPVGAVTVGDIAAVDEAVCIGCGVCTPTCGGGGAITLSVRKEVVPPPEVGEFLGARLKT